MLLDRDKFRSTLFHFILYIYPNYFMWETGSNFLQASLSRYFISYKILQEFKNYLFKV